MFKRKCLFLSINGFLEFTNVDLKIVDSILSESIDIIKSSSVDYSDFIENKNIIHII